MICLTVKLYKEPAFIKLGEKMKKSYKRFSANEAKEAEFKAEESAKKTRSIVKVSPSGLLGIKRYPDIESKYNTIIVFNDMTDLSKASGGFIFVKKDALILNGMPYDLVVGHDAWEKCSEEGIDSLKVLPSAKTITNVMEDIIRYEKELKSERYFVRIGKKENLALFEVDNSRPDHIYQGLYIITNMKGLDQTKEGSEIKAGLEKIVKRNW